MKNYIFDKTKLRQGCTVEFIGDLLMNTQSVTVLHLTPDCNHYETHSREYAIIKALGLQNLSNV